MIAASSGSRCATGWALSRQSHAHCHGKWQPPGRPLALKPTPGSGQSLALVHVLASPSAAARA